jgi:glycerate kinase
VPGGAALIDWLGYREHLEKADLILTGEGKLDAQTSGGKAVQQVAAVAKAKGIPVIALAGGLDASPADLNAMGIRAAFSLVPGPATLDQAIQHAESWLRAAACHVGNVLALRPN